MSREAGRNRWLWVILFLVALSVRLYRVDWDQHHFFHPDERAIGFAVERLSFRPLQLNPHFFAYGSLPLYAIKIATSIAGKFSAPLAGYDASIFAGRVLSALWGAATAVLVGVLGSRLYGKRVGLLAGVLMASAVLHVQNSHFATSDVPLTFFVLLALYFLVRVVEQGALAHYLAAGFSAGLAIATKFSALPILLPIAIAILYRWFVEGRRLSTLIRGAGAVLSVVVGFALGQPYAILDYHAFRADILEQSRMVRHAGLVPYTNQYIGVPKYIYDLQQMILWGMGPLLGLAAVIGTGVCGVRAFRQRRVPELVLLAWVLPFFLITGSFDVKFPRYLLPIYPLLILWAAALLVSVASRSGVGTLAAALVLVSTFAWLIAFMRIYSLPHTVVSASNWFYSHVPSGTKVASQHWDEGFPFPMPGGLNPDRYRIVDLPYYEPDTPEKMRQISAELASSEYAAFQTKRIYGAVTQAPKKFPLTSRYFYHLFAGDLGYSLTQSFASRPKIFGIEFPDELADESFTVYDHPKVLIFQNKAHLPDSALITRILSGSTSRRLARRDILLADAGRLARSGKSGQYSLEPPPPPTAVEPSPAPAAEKEAEKEAAPAGRLEQPRGIAADEQDRIFVCDFGHDRIQVFDKTFRPISGWGRTGTAPGQFKQPGALALGPDNSVYVADTWNSRVQEFDRNGSFRREWTSDFFGPRGIAVGPRGDVFVSDTGNHRIVRFSKDGVKQLEFGGKGAEAGKLFEPAGVAVSSDGRVFVCDNGNGRMQIFDANGKALRAFDVSGWRREVFSEPQVALDPRGTLWVTVPLDGEVRHYGGDGKLLQAIRGRAPGASFARPMGIALDAARDALFVSDLEGRLARIPIATR